MQDAARFQMVEGEEHLGRIGAHGADVKPDAAAVFLRQIPQIHVHALEYQAHVTSVLERVEQLDNVHRALGVCV